MSPEHPWAKVFEEGSDSRVWGYQKQYPRQYRDVCVTTAKLYTVWIPDSCGNFWRR